jgi:hypothetical protein
MPSHFEITHIFNRIDRQGYIALLLDDEFNGWLEQQLPVKERKVIEHSEQNGVIVRRIRIDSGRKLPPAAARVVGADHVHYIETSVYRKGGDSLCWEISPSVMSDKIKSSGMVSFVEIGEKTVRRVIKGELTVRVFGVGRIVEKAIIERLGRGFDQIAALTQKYIDETLPERLTAPEL